MTFTLPLKNNYLRKPTIYYRHKKIAEKSRKRKEALWIDWKDSSNSADVTPFRFTGKERDDETGLYYYGARYLDPRTSRWMSADPAMYQGDYIPSAPVNDEARKRNGNLPGQEGIYNYVNMHVYHYAGNNPVKYTDPDGRDFDGFILLGDSFKQGLNIFDNATSEPSVEKAMAMTDSALKIFGNIEKAFAEHLVVGALFECGKLVYDKGGLFKDIVDIAYEVLDNSFMTTFGKGETESIYKLGLGFSSDNNNFSIINKNFFNIFHKSVIRFEVGLNLNFTFSNSIEDCKSSIDKFYFGIKIVK